MRTDGLVFRVGRHVPYTLYIQLGSRPDGRDVFVGSCRTAGMAAQLVRLANVGYQVIADGGEESLIETLRGATE